MGIRYYTGTEAEMLALDTIITQNCGWPNNGTDRWAAPKETVDSGVFAIPVPEGSHGFTKEQMTNGITAQEIENVQFPVIEGI